MRKEVSELKKGVSDACFRMARNQEVQMLSEATGMLAVGIPGGYCLVLGVGLLLGSHQDGGSTAIALQLARDSFKYGLNNAIAQEPLRHRLSPHSF
jgi:hypothetical protein